MGSQPLAPEHEQLRERCGQWLLPIIPGQPNWQNKWAEMTTEGNCREGVSEHWIRNRASHGHFGLGGGRAGTTR